MQEYFVKLATFVGQPQIVLGAGAAGIAAVQEQAEGVRAVAISQEAYEGDESALIAGIRLGIWDQVKARRDAAIDAGADTPAGRVDTDAASRSNITGAVVAAMLSQQLGSPFSVDWTLADNSVVTLDATALMGVGMAVVSHVDAAHAAARALRTAIEAADTPVALLQIDIIAGWPGAQGGQ